MAALIHELFLLGIGAHLRFHSRKPGHHLDHRSRAPGGIQQDAPVDPPAVASIQIAPGLCPPHHFPILPETFCDHFGFRTNAFIACLASLGSQGGECLIAPRKTPGQQSECQNAKRENIPAVALLLEISPGIEKLLRRLVKEGVGETELGDARHVSQRPVGKPHASLPGEIDVSRLQVAVRHTPRMHP